MTDTLLQSLCDALTYPAAPLEPIVRGDDTHEPWTRAVDVDEAPTWDLPWLACLVGEEWRGPGSEILRAQIRDRPRFRRGTTASIAAAAKATLTGTRDVTIVDRVDDNPNLLTVITSPTETPNQDVTFQVMRRMTPAWVQLTYIVSDVPVIDTLPAVAIDSLPNAPIDSLTG